MDMVGHETIGMEGVTELPSVAAKPFEIGLVIGATEKNLSPSGAAHDDVIEQPRGKQSGSARHDWDLYKNIPSVVKIVMKSKSDPFSFSFSSHFGQPLR